MERLWKEDCRCYTYMGSVICQDIIMRLTNNGLRLVAQTSELYVLRVYDPSNVLVIQMNAREKEILKKFWDFKVKGNNYKPINGLHR